MASTTSLGIDSILANTLFEPPGRTVSGVPVPARPFATSFTVPSPPNAATTSNLSSVAAMISSVACPRCSVSTTWTSYRPCSA